MDLKIPTGSDIFDEFTEGGYEKDILTTIYGPGGSGKTTLCLLASINQARQKKKVIYIDTEGGFSIERLKQLAGDEFEEILKYIIILKPTSFEKQNDVLQKLNSIINEKIGLIIIDTATIFYRLELAKGVDVRIINYNLIIQIAVLTEIAREKNIPVIATNQVYSDFNLKDEFKMVGGDILRYSSKCLIKLNNKDKKRLATIVSHRSIPEGKELTFSIINEGIIKA